MHWYEKLGAHILLFCVFTALCLNTVLLAKLRISWWGLPMAYGLYCAGWLAWRRPKPTKRQLGIIVLLPLVFLIIAQALGMLYDTSWDGQDYQQSGVIAFHEGWNPWYSDKLPMTLPQSAEYVVGYPKTTWLLQDSIYEFTGHLQTATVINVVVAVAAGLLTYGVCVQLGVRRQWALVLTVLATLEIHALQQLPTFLEDGYSYETALAALAAGMLYIRQRRLLYLSAFLAAWLLLAGSKFSNLFVCALLGVACITYLLVAQAYRRRCIWYMAGTFMGACLLLLWVPFGTNLLRHSSPVYPQNEAAAATKLLDDNVPNNLKSASRPVLLFYGIFSHIQRSDAGNPASPNNVAMLKIPFTFEPYELEQLNNFQGRVGSGGLLFSGCIVIALFLYIVAVLQRKTKQEQRLVLGVTVVGLSIVIAALVVPVSNKLRYSPLVTLLPLLVLLLFACRLHPKKWLRLGAALLTLGVISNISVAAIVFAVARTHEASVITAQLATLRYNKPPIIVDAHNLYSSYIRLQEHHIPFIAATSLPCKQPEALEYTNWTTEFCRQ